MVLDKVRMELVRRGARVTSAANKNPPSRIAKEGWRGKQKAERV